ncbi:LafX [Aeromonas jandaei]|uniref:LafX n=1 Tax=Aeromonas jandaei TaxID=650 RepID=UPI001ABF8375|nr:LafX [Aeromonas jandaei]QSR71437.1 LafX [Aeromonas jandaei]
MPLIGSTDLPAELDKRQRQLLGLGRLILQQAHAGQWDAVRLSDSKLARFAELMAKEPELWASLSAARAQVRSWHQEAQQLCRQEVTLREREWHELSRKREGLQAYGEVQEWA